MEILFECNHTRSKSFFKEIMVWSAFKRKLALIPFAIFIIYALIGILILDLMFVILAVLMTALWIGINYIAMYKVQLSREMELSGGKEPTYHTIVTADGKIIQESEHRGRAEVDFLNIRSVLETKNYIFFRTKANLLFPISKSGFTKGTLEEFLNFLKGKKLYK